MKLNVIGPMTEPCGTPQGHFHIISTGNLDLDTLSARQLTNQSATRLNSAALQRLPFEREWHTVLKERSIKSRHLQKLGSLCKCLQKKKSF